MSGTPNNAGKVWIVGAGPGAPDLLTLRAARAIEKAEVLIWTDSLVNPQLAAMAPAGCERIRTSTLTLEEVMSSPEVFDPLTRYPVDALAIASHTHPRAPLLTEEHVDAQFGGVLAVLFRRARGDHDNRQAIDAIVGTHILGEIKAIHARHFHVGDHHIRQLIAYLLQRFNAILGHRDVIAFTRQQTVGDLAHRE